MSDRTQATSGVQYNATTPNNTSGKKSSLQGDNRGVAYIGAAIRHRRVVVPSTTTVAALAEGPCDEIRIGGAGATEAVVVFGQPPERDWLILNGGFDSADSWTLGANWAIAAGIATHTAGATATLSQDTGAENPNDPIVDSETYVLVFTVSGRTAGSVTASVSGTAGTVRSTNDTFGEAITGAGGGSETLLFTPTSDFDGSIDNVFLFPMNGGYQIGVSEPDAFLYIAGAALASAPDALVTTIRIEAGWYRRAGATEID